MVNLADFQFTDWQIEIVAFMAFCRNMEDYELPEGRLQVVFYGDEQIRAFWVKEARNWLSGFIAALNETQPEGECN